MSPETVSFTERCKVHTPENPEIAIVKLAQDIGDFTVLVHPVIHDGDRCIWVNWAIVEAITEDDEGEGYPVIDKGPGKPYYTADPKTAETTASGYIKWDGCSQTDLESGHCCGGIKGVQKMFAAIAEAMALAAKELTQTLDDDTWETP